MAQPLLTARNIHKSFTHGGVTMDVLGGIDLQLYGGQSVALIGPSGCGKSTLLNILCGLEGYDRGAIDSARQSAVGYIQQNDSLLPWKTVLENCILPLELHRGGGAHADRGRQLLTALRLSEFADHYPHQISGGMRQKVSFARAIIERPHILLLDEPFRSLDGITKLEMYRWYAELRQRDALATVLVTHDVYEAATLADRAIICSHRPMTIQTIIDAAAYDNGDQTAASAAEDYARAIYGALHGGMGTRTPDLRHAKPSL